MESFEALKVEENKIVLTNEEDLQKVYRYINDNKDFALRWTEHAEGQDYAHWKVIVAEGLAPKPNRKTTTSHL